ncbi:MAG: hypothetical protein KJ977_05335 [Candidatus Omnitrophica bacterium]|nr:hypothetical protein [Candidatus Omnitrophota bacterium]
MTTVAEARELSARVARERADDHARDEGRAIGYAVAALEAFGNGKLEEGLSLLDMANIYGRMGGGETGPRTTAIRARAWHAARALARKYERAARLLTPVGR